MIAAQVEFSQEAAYARRSIIRDLIAQAVDPKIISFAVGLPPSELLPVEEYQDCFNAVLARDGGRAMQYGPPYMPLREQITDLMRARGVKCETSQVYITNGSQQSLNILSRLFLDAGSPAVVEEATFTGINLVTSGRGAKMRIIPTDLCTGADMDAMEAAFGQNPHPRMAVLIPDFHNPLGVSLSLEKRQRAADLSNRYQVPLLEDDPYSLLRFAGEMLPPIKTFDEAGTVLYLGSFSKILAPALRLGWIIAPEELIARIILIREPMDLETSNLTQRAAAEFLSRGLLAPHLEQMNRENRIRRDAMLQALDKHLADIAHWTEPQGGLFIWLTVPESINTLTLVREAIDNGVVYIPGAAFSANGGQEHTLRLNFSAVPPEKIEEGVARLAEVILRHL